MEARRPGRILAHRIYYKEFQATPNIRVRYNTEAVDGHGEGRLTGLTLKDGRHPRGP